MGPAITQELPGGELLRIGRVGDVDDVHEAADASKALADVVRQAVRGPAAHVARAALQLDASFQDRAAAVGGQVINGKPRPVPFGDREELAPRVHLQSLLRVQRRGIVVQVRAHPWMPWVRDIHHHDAGCC